MILLLFFNLTTGVWAHPHVFADNNIVFVFDRNGLAGVQIRWTFDELYSSSLILDYDKNRDHTFNPVEIRELTKQALSDLKGNHYFTHIRMNGREFSISTISDFKVAIKKNRAVYSFFVPCPMMVKASEQTADVSCYDETYYIEIASDYQKAAAVDDKFGFHHRLFVTDDEENCYYFGQVLPQKITVKFWR
jgi:ABC-type uncharacterized transport system substrate-binding protein